MIFVRFSRPVARIAFSRSIVIGPLNGQPTLMVRVGNQHQHSIVDTEFRIMFMRDEPLVEGGDFRYFYTLKLHFDRLILFPAALTLRHVIDRSSPLYGATLESLEASRSLFCGFSLRNRSGHCCSRPGTARLQLARCSLRRTLHRYLHPVRPRPAHGGLRSPSRNRTCGVNFARAPDVASFCGGRDSHYRFSPHQRKE